MLRDKVKTTIQVLQLSIQILIHYIIIGKHSYLYFFLIEKNSYFQYLCKRRIWSKRDVCLPPSIALAQISKLKITPLNSQAKIKIVLFYLFRNLEVLCRHSDCWVLCKCLDICNQIWDRLRFLLHPAYIHKDQCSRNLLNQVFPL